MRPGRATSLPAVYRKSRRLRAKVCEWRRFKGLKYRFIGCSRKRVRAASEESKRPPRVGICRGGKIKGAASVRGRRSIF